MALEAKFEAAVPGPVEVASLWPQEQELITDVIPPGVSELIKDTGPG